MAEDVDWRGVAVKLSGAAIAAGEQFGRHLVQAHIDEVLPPAELDALEAAKRELFRPVDF